MRPYFVRNYCALALLLGSAQVAQAELPPVPLPAEQKAVAFSGTLVNFAEYNPSGGVNPDSWGNTALIELGADFSLEKLFGWTGTAVKVRESLFRLRHNAVLNPGPNPPASLTGHFWANDIGSTLGGAPFPNFIPNNYLSDLTISQRLGQHLTLEFGRMNPMTRFDIPMNCENILSCQNPVNLYDNLTLPPAFATWGALARYQFDNHSYAQVGVHEDNFALGETSGVNWSAKNRSGWFYIAEFGYRKDFGETTFPWNVTAGMWHDTSTFTEAINGEQQKGSDGAYLRTQKVAWRDDSGLAQGRPAKYLMTFATAGYSPSAAQSYRSYLEVGANLHGIIPGRPTDHVGAKLAYLKVNDNQLDFERMVRLHTSAIDYRSPADQFRVELNAHIDLRPGVFIEPVAQYIVNPNVQFIDPLHPIGKPRNGFVLGLTMFAHIQ